MKRYVFGTSPLGPSRKVKAAVRAAVKDINSPADEASEWLMKILFSRYGIRKENLFFSGSVKELVFLISQVLSPKRVLVAVPAMGMYKEAAIAAGAAVHSMNTDAGRGWLYDTEVLGKESAVHNIAFVANPNHITGKLVESPVFESMIDLISDSGCIAVVDESLIGFTSSEGCIRKAAGSVSLIVLRTTANYYGLAGLELAYAVSSDKIISLLKRNSRSDINLLAVEAARAALKDRTFRRLSTGFIAKEKSLIQKAIRRITGAFTYDSDSNIFLVRLPDKAADLAVAAGKSGLAVELCDKIDGLDSSFVRISVMQHDHNLKLIRLLNRSVAEKA